VVVLYRELDDACPEALARLAETLQHATKALPVAQVRDAGGHLHRDEHRQPAAERAARRVRDAWSRSVRLPSRPTASTAVCAKLERELLASLSSHEVKTRRATRTDAPNLDSAENVPPGERNSLRGSGRDIALRVRAAAQHPGRDRSRRDARGSRWGNVTRAPGLDRHHSTGPFTGPFIPSGPFSLESADIGPRGEASAAAHARRLRCGDRPV